MNKIAKTFLKTFVVSAMMTPMLVSCQDSFIYEDQPECNIGARLRFVYEYNMEYANAFHTQSDCVTVFFYDTDGNYVKMQEEVGDALRDENYRMDVDLAPGTYNIVAYAGAFEDHTSFQFDSHPSNGHHVSNNVLNLKDMEIGNELHPLFFGTAEMTCNEDDLDYQETTVYLIKDTNAIRVLLQQVDGEPLTHDMFTFKLHADNTVMEHDNRVTLTGKNTLFTPWTLDNENPGEHPDGTPASVCWAEFSIPRLVDQTQITNLNTRANTFDEYQGPILQINYKADDREVVNIPLIKYLLMCKPVKSNHVDGHLMSDQEFLDRESRYNLFFFLDRSYQWLYMQIQVEDWVVRINNINM